MNKFDSMTRSLFSDQLSKSIKDDFSEGYGKRFVTANSNQFHHPTEYQYQEFIRTAFGKEGLNSLGTGAHPDFSYLKDCHSVENYYILTLFVDIKRSSRLNLSHWIKLLLKKQNSSGRH